MRHATPQTLSSLETLITQLRTLPLLQEKKPGVYYLKSKAFLHFHEDNQKVFADVRLNPPEFTRVPATTAKEQSSLIKAIRRHLE